MRKIESIEELIGEQLAGVGFIRDYVEFYFDGPIIRSLSVPNLNIGGVEHQFPEPGSRDALCGTIGSTVTAVKVDEGRSVRIETDDGSILTIPLDPRSNRVPEAMHFVPQIDGPIQIW